MLGIVIGDLVVLDCGVDLRVFPQSLQGRPRHEGKVGQLDAFACLEVALGPLPQLGDRGQVDLDDGGQLSCHLQRLHHALGDDPAQAGDLLLLAAQARRDGN